MRPLRNSETPRPNFQFFSGSETPKPSFQFSQVAQPENLVFKFRNLKKTCKPALLAALNPRESLCKLAWGGLTSLYTEPE